MSERDVSAEDGVPAGREWQEELHRSRSCLPSALVLVAPGGKNSPSSAMEHGALAGQPNDARVLIYLDFRKRKADNRP